MERAKLIDIACLSRLQEELRAFAGRDDLNGFQRWIVSDLYAFAPEEADFEPKSVLLIAVPQPPWAEVTLAYNGCVYRCRSLVGGEYPAAEREARAWAQACGARICPAPRLPFKRLAVQCGLAEYGRNNITNIPGLGSSFGYMAYFTDQPPEDNTWREMRTARACEGCGKCVKACPTGAILPDRFLIDNTRCLSCLNESADEMPPWVSPQAHHTLYDCLRCQEICPMNAAVQHDIPHVDFDESETALLLDGAPLDTLPSALKKKADFLRLEAWYPALARNIRLIMAQQDTQPEM